MTHYHFDHYKAIITRQGFIQETLISCVQLGITKVTVNKMGYAEDCLKLNASGS